MRNLIKTTTELALYLVEDYVESDDIVIDATCGNGQDTLRLAEMDPAKLFAFDIQARAIENTQDRLKEHGYGEALDSGRFQVIRLAHENMAAFFRSLPPEPATSTAVGSDGELESPDSDAGSATEPGASDPGAGPSEGINASDPDAGPAEGINASDPDIGPGEGINASDPDTRPFSRPFAGAIVFNLGFLPGGNKEITTRSETTLEAIRQSMDLLVRNGLICVTMYSGHDEGKREKAALLRFAEDLDPHVWHVSYIQMLNQKKDPPEILLISRKSQSRT